MGSGSGDQTTVQKADPWSGVQPYLSDIFSQAQGLYQQGALADLPFPSQTVAPLTPAQEAGIQGLAEFGQTPLFRQTIGGLGQVFSQGTAQQPVATAGAYAPMGQGSDIMLGYDPSRFGQGIAGASPELQQQTEQTMSSLMQGTPDYSNIQALTQAATRPMVRQFQEQVLPSIGHAAVAAGQVGGSRQGVAQGIAARGLTERIGDVSTQLAENERLRALQAQQAAMGLGAQQGVMGQQLGQQALSDAARLGLSAEQMRAQAGQGLGQLALGQQQLASSLAPQIAQMGMLPYQNLLQAGGLQRQFAQQQISDLANRYQMLQAAPAQALGRYASIIQPGSGLGGTQTTTQEAGGGIMNALGSGLAGGAMMGAIPMMGGGPFGWGLAALGAGAGLLGGL